MFDDLQIEEIKTNGMNHFDAHDAKNKSKNERNETNVNAIQLVDNQNNQWASMNMQLSPLSVPSNNHAQEMVRTRSGSLV